MAAWQGAFLNDAYVLDLSTFTWRRPSVLAASPMGRHGALAAVLGGRVVMACGMCASGPLDSIVTVTADFGVRSCARPCYPQRHVRGCQCCAHPPVLKVVWTIASPSAQVHCRATNCALQAANSVRAERRRGMPIAMQLARLTRVAGLA